VSFAFPPAPAAGIAVVPGGLLPNSLDPAAAAEAKGKAAAAERWDCC